MRKIYHRIVISIRKSSYITYNPISQLRLSLAFQPTLFERILRPMFSTTTILESRPIYSLVPGDGYSRDYLNWATLLDDYHRGLTNCTPRQRNVFTVSKDRYLESLDEIFPLINTMFHVDNWLKFDALVVRRLVRRISMRLACAHLRNEMAIIWAWRIIDRWRSHAVEVWRSRMREDVN